MNGDMNGWGDVIQFWSLLLALIGLLIQQAWQFAEERRKERRISIKLTIFYLCQDMAFTEDDLIATLEERYYRRKYPVAEFRKALYEMLADETLRYRTNGTYRARRNKAVEETDS